MVHNTETPPALHRIAVRFVPCIPFLLQRGLLVFVKFLREIPQNTPTFVGVETHKSNVKMAPSKSALIVALVMVAVATLAARVDAQRPAVVRSCFVRNCGACSGRNPYVCVTCNTGYALSGAAGCNSCSVNYEQNLDDRAFSCIACPAGTSSPGGTGLASQCTPISVSSGRRLFADADEALWA